MWEERLLCLGLWGRFHMRKDTGWGLECEWDLPEHTGAGLGNRISSLFCFLQIKQFQKSLRGKGTCRLGWGD